MGQIQEDYISICIRTVSVDSCILLYLMFYFYFLAVEHSELWYFKHCLHTYNTNKNIYCMTCKVWNSGWTRSVCLLVMMCIGICWWPYQRAFFFKFNLSLSQTFFPQVHHLQSVQEDICSRKQCSFLWNLRAKAVLMLSREMIIRVTQLWATCQHYTVKTHISSPLKPVSDTSA